MTLLNRNLRWKRRTEFTQNSNTQANVWFLYPCRTQQQVGDW